MDSVGQCRGWGLRDVSLMFWIKLVTGLQGATAGERKRVYNITKETICKKICIRIFMTHSAWRNQKQNWKQKLKVKNR